MSGAAHVKSDHGTAVGAGAGASARHGSSAAQPTPSVQRTPQPRRTVGEWTSAADNYTGYGLQLSSAGRASGGSGSRHSHAGTEGISQRSRSAPKMRPAFGSAIMPADASSQSVFGAAGNHSVLRPFEKTGPAPAALASSTASASAQSTAPPPLQNQRSSRDTNDLNLRAPQQVPRQFQASVTDSSAHSTTAPFRSSSMQQRVRDDNGMRRQSNAQNAYDIYDNGAPIADEEVTVGDYDDEVVPEMPSRYYSGGQQRAQRYDNYQPQSFSKTWTAGSGPIVIPTKPVRSAAAAAAAPHSAALRRSAPVPPPPADDDEALQYGDVSGDLAKASAMRIDSAVLAAKSLMHSLQADLSDSNAAGAAHAKDNRSVVL